MSKSLAFANAWLLYLFNNVPIQNIGDAAGLRATTTAGSLWLAWYTADPGELGTAVTNETGYTGYWRMPLARSSSDWLVVGQSVSPVVDVLFGKCTGSPGWRRRNGL